MPALIAAIEVVNARCLNRLKAALRKNGPLTWAGARLAMWGGSYDRRDAAAHNSTLTGWIDAGELKSVELENGDSLVGL